MSSRLKEHTREFPTQNPCTVPCVRRARTACVNACISHVKNSAPDAQSVLARTTLTGLSVLRFSSHKVHTQLLAFIVSQIMATKKSAGRRWSDEFIFRKLVPPFRTKAFLQAPMSLLSPESTHSQAMKMVLHIQKEHALVSM